MEASEPLIDEDSLGVALNHLSAGAQFGEKALQESNLKRNATVQTKEDTHLLVLHKQYYAHIIKLYGNQFLFKSQQLRKVLPALDKVASKKTLDTLMYYFKDENYHRGQLITRYSPSPLSLQNGQHVRHPLLPG